MREETEKDLSFTLVMIQKELSSFVSLLDSKDHVVRRAVSELIGSVNDLGLIQLIDASKLFVRMLSDCNYSSFTLANTALKSLTEKKIQLVIVSSSPQDLILEAYRY